MPAGQIRQIHQGHEGLGRLSSTRTTTRCDEVWAFYAEAMRRFWPGAHHDRAGPHPPLPELLAELGGLGTWLKAIAGMTTLIAADLAEQQRRLRRRHCACRDPCKMCWLPRWSPASASTGTPIGPAALAAFERQLHRALAARWATEHFLNAWGRAGTSMRTPAANSSIRWFGYASLISWQKLMNSASATRASWTLRAWTGRCATP